VIELGQLIAGPFAGRMLAEFGAEVIKIEPPGVGDAMREWGMHRHLEHGLWWPLQSRNKKLVTLDLRQERGRRLLLPAGGTGGRPDRELPAQGPWNAGASGRRLCTGRVQVS